jgi:hypothetical protein
MATLTINGQKVTVGDEFLKLPPDQQNATVDEIAKTLPRNGTTAPAAPAEPKPLDKYQQAALADRNKLLASGVDPSAGLTRLGLQGATFNTADELVAGALAPLEMIKRGTWDPREGYRYAKAREDMDLEEGRKKAGWGGTVADVTGGVMSGAGLARAGVTAGRFLGQNAGILPRSAAAAADAGVMGAAAGLGEGNSFEERFNNAKFGGAVGTGVGALTPGVLKVAGAALSPIVSNVRARVNPEGYARSQVARSMSESNLTPQQIADDVALAHREGQGVYTVADAMGTPGQRMLSTVTRAPGQGRTDVTEFLDARQAGQGRRVTNALVEGFDAPVTAQNAQTRLTAAQKAAADVEYEAARQGAQPVNLNRAIAAVDEIVPPGAKGEILPDSIEAVLQNVRRRMTAGGAQVSDYVAVERLRGDLSDMAQKATKAGEGNRARLLGKVVRQIDDAMEAASPGFKQANANFAGRQRVINAIEEGQTAATRGRTEDTIPAFQAMNQPQQMAYRMGYADPHIASTQGAPVGANKARPFTSDAFRDEAAAISRDSPLLTRRLDREGRMFETRAQATGNSKTAENLADDAAMSVDPSLIGNIISGNWGGAARGLLSAGQNALTGNTPAVRAEVGRILTMRGGNVTPQQLQGILEQAVTRVRMAQLLASISGRGAAGGLAIADQRLKR